MIVARLYLVSVLSLLVAPGCSSGQQGPLFGSILGSAALRINTTSDEGVAWLQYQVMDGAARVLVEESVHPAPWGSLAFEFELPPGNGYALALAGETVGGQACAGAAVFDVSGGRSTDVAVDLACPRPEPGIASAPPSASQATPDTPLPVGSGVVPSPPSSEPSAAAAGEELSDGRHVADAGDGGSHECPSAASSEPVRIQFAATVGGAPFSCAGAGAAPAGAAKVEPRDLRLFVHDVHLIDSNGGEAAVAIDQRAPFQALGTALLDFEDATGSCSSGDPATNAVITGRVRPGAYTGVRFRIGVPESLNHADPALQPAPLGAGTMSWGWLAGYKFLRAEIGSEAGGAALHLGTTACTGDPGAGAVSCARSNRPNITLAGFDAARDTIVADISALFGAGALSSALSCHSTGAACEPLFAALGLDLQDGSSAGAQTVFRVAR